MRWIGVEGGNSHAPASGSRGDGRRGENSTPSGRGKTAPRLEGLSFTLCWLDGRKYGDIKSCRKTQRVGWAIRFWISA
jgi:hypothetical protein